MVMLDIQVYAPAGRPVPVVGEVEFLRIDLSPLADGRVFVSMTATTVDEQEPQLLDQEIASDHVATIDDALALIRAHVTIAARSANRKEH